MKLLFFFFLNRGDVLLAKDDTKDIKQQWGGGMMASFCTCFQKEALLNVGSDDDSGVAHVKLCFVESN